MNSTLLADQIAYYRARAAEYDEWFYRQGRYDHGEVLNRQWFEEVEEVRKALLSLPHAHSALELACGTGIWTQELVKIADRVTAVDASPEMLAINGAKINSDRVRYQELDLFNWVPADQYDLIFFGFWLSHVPPQLLAPFLSKIAQSLTPSGRVFIIDSRKEPSSTARDMHIPDDGFTLERKLNDGRTFQIIKVFYDSETLMHHFLSAGLQSEVRATDHYFIWATASRL